MKKIKGIIGIVAFFIMTLCSCTKGNEGTVKLVKKTLETSAEGTVSTTFYTYSENQIVSMDNANSRTDFTYTDGLITKKVVLDKLNQETVTTEYSYEKALLVVAKTIEKDVINYVHNADGTVSYEKFALVAGVQGDKLHHGKLYFDKKNHTKDERILDDVAVGVVSKNTVSYEFDDKRSPFGNVLGFNKLLDQKEGLSSNNSLMCVIIASVEIEGQETSSANLYKSTFSYDKEGYPRELVVESPAYLKTNYFYE